MAKIEEAAMTGERYDAVIVGAGQSGMPLSRAFAGAGWKTALIEREHVGGTCINEGCTPTKTMIASARVAYVARRASDYGVRVGPVSVDLAAVRDRKRRMVDSFRSSNERRLEKAGVHRIDGEARFVDDHTLEVDTAEGTLTIRGDRIFINTGTRPAMPQIPGLSAVRTLTSTTIMELDELPDHLVVLGGGYVGVEFAQMFRRFGSRVTIVQIGDQLLRQEDPDVAGELAKILEEDGIDIVLNGRTDSVERDDGAIRLSVRTPTGMRTVRGSHLLVATGRKPNSDSLNLQAAGVRADEEGYIPVNDRLQTNVPHIYALGEANGGPAFTHMSYDDYRVIRANLLNGGDATTAGRLVPYTVFTDPQLGRVGMTESGARAGGYDIRVARIPMDYVARALETGESRGFMKAVVDARTDRILGAAVLGTEGGEIVAMIEIAMLARMPCTVLRDAIFAHPTLAESLNTLFGSLED
jgi:pyruvate/2-oxoglutarate dehydrogenase complex dihydrolipoamide dehydrogenase (E3) component